MGSTSSQAPPGHNIYSHYYHHSYASSSTHAPPPNQQHHHHSNSSSSHHHHQQHHHATSQHSEKSTASAYSYSYSFNGGHASSDTPEDLLLILENPYDSNKLTVRTIANPIPSQTIIKANRNEFRFQSNSNFQIPMIFQILFV